MDQASVANTVISIQNSFQVISSLLLTSYYWPKGIELNECPVEYDMIVVGAGSAGCALAARLAEAKFKVLLIEAGDDPPIETTFPGLYSYLIKSHVDWNYKGEPDKYGQCLKSRLTMSRGRMLGGSGSMNGNLYVRGNPHDFELWAAAANDSTWNYEEVLPFFIKSENVRDEEILKSQYAPYHGTKGPMKVTRQPHEEEKVYLEAFKEAGHKILLDINGNETLGYTEPSFTIFDGIRQSSGVGFIAGNKNPYLHILKKTLVTKVLFDDSNNAVGVEALTDENKTITIKASKELILSAGVFNSPKLLMLSGMGPKEHLDKFGIQVRSDLPVGENLQDHISFLVVHSMDRSKSPTVPKQLPQEFPGYLIIGFSALNKSQSYPDYQTFNYRFENDCESVILFCSVLYAFKDEICDHLIENCKDRALFINVITGLHMKSRGTVSLRSIKPDDDPIIRLGMLSYEEDVERSANFIEDFIKVGNTSYFQSVDAELILLDLPGCDDHEKGSHEYWKCYARCLWTTSYHYAGTCALGAVVDSHLRVFGVNKLRVADSSVMPTVTSGNTNAPSVMIGEKAANFIIQDHKSNVD